MTLGADDKPFIITDGVINVLPKLGVKMHILRNAVDFANKLESPDQRSQYYQLQKKC
jgi:phosphotransacetylase